MRYAAFALAIVLSCISLAAGSSPVTLRGQILHEDQPLPGVTVRLLELDRVIAEVVSDIDGRYAIVDPPRGYYELEASLDGLDAAIRELYVGSDDLVVEALSLQLAPITEEIVMACGSPCGGDDQPTCDDYEKNRELEAAVPSNPRALDELRVRYRRTTSREELARIGGFLVGVLQVNDGEYFQPLAQGTETLLTLAEQSEDELASTHPGYIAWCNSVGRDPVDELWVLYRETEALFSSTDSRVIPFAHRALRVSDFALRMYAIDFVSLTCDASLLHAVYEDFDSLAEALGAYALMRVIPCEDRVLNARIMALGEVDVEKLLPELIESRNAQLARLGATGR